MITARLSAEDDFDGWRDQCRGLLRIGAKPEDVIWQVGDTATDLFAATATPTAPRMSRNRFSPRSPAMRAPSPATPSSPGGSTPPRATPRSIS